ncbi:MAG: hypothetical protein ABEJ89_09790 [Haloarculaceae archaeon]
MDRDRLETALVDRYDAEETVIRAVAREARDLADSGRFAEDFDGDLTVDDVLSNLADAPDGRGLVERWNWWLGSMEVSHGGYERFRVRPDLADDAR